VHFLPVRSARREAVSEITTVIRRSLARQRHRTIRREQIRIEKDACGGVPSILHVQDVLILETGVLEIEVAAAFLERRAVSRIIPELSQAVLDCGPLGNACEEAVRELVLRFDPRLGRRRVGILQPPIRIGDADAVLDVDRGAAGG
jgi:hypothetical protein